LGVEHFLLDIMPAPETELNYGQETSDGMYKGSLQGSRLPFPNKKAEFLNTGALRKLIPSQRPISPGSRPLEDEENETKEILRRMRKGDGRLKELDRKASKEQARRIRIEDEKRTKALRNNRKRRKKNNKSIDQDEIDENNETSLSLEKDLQSRIDENDSEWFGFDDNNNNSSMMRESTYNKPIKLSIDEIAPEYLLSNIGMTRNEFISIDRAYKTIVKPPTSSYSSSSSQMSRSTPSVFYSPQHTQPKSEMQNINLTIEDKLYEALKSIDPISLNDKDAMNAHDSDDNLNAHSDLTHLKGQTVTSESIKAALSSQGIHLDTHALEKALKYSSKPSQTTSSSTSRPTSSSSSTMDATEGTSYKTSSLNKDKDFDVMIVNSSNGFGDTWGDNDEEDENEKMTKVEPKIVKSKSNVNATTNDNDDNMNENVTSTIKVKRIKVNEKQSYELTSPLMLKNRLLASLRRSMIAQTLVRPRSSNQLTGSFSGHDSKDYHSSSSSTTTTFLPLAPLSLASSHGASGASGTGGGLRPVKMKARSTARRHLASTQASQPQPLQNASSSGIGSLSTSSLHQQQQQQHNKKANNNSNSSIIRSTPRLLKRGAQGDIIELREELQESEKGLLALEQAVKQDVQWVSLNVSRGSENMTMRASFFCKQWSVEKIQILFTQSELNRQRLFLHKWATACDMAYNSERLELFLRFSATRKFLLTINRALFRSQRNAFKFWQKEYFLEKEEEKDAACCEIQRIVLGFLGKTKFLKLRHQRACIVLQSAIRVSRAIAKVRIARRAKLEQEAADLISKNWNDVMLCRKAKLYTQELRERKAANLIQKISRNRITVKKAKLYVQEQRVNVNALKIQQLLRRKFAKRKVYVLKRIKYEQKCALQIQLCWRCYKARIIYKHKVKQMEGCITLQCWARCMASNIITNKLRIQRDRRLAAESIQRASRTRKANKVVKHKRKVKRDREEREASINIQKLARQRKANKEVAEKRAERDRKILERKNAATRIQSSQRAKKSREIVQIKREEEAARVAEAKRIAAIEDAASRQIQKGARGHRDRKYAKIKHEEREVRRALQRQLEYDSATKIQAQVRRRKAIKKVLARRKYRVDEDSEGGQLIEEKAIIIQCAFRTAMAKSELHDRLVIKYDKQAAAEKEARELARIKAAEELAELERQRLAQIELENKSAIVLQNAERCKNARILLAQKKFEEAERIRLEAEAEERRRRNAAATQIQRIMRGYLASLRVGERRAELSFIELCGGGASREIKALQIKLRDDLFHSHHHHHHDHNKSKNVSSTSTAIAESSEINENEIENELEIVHGKSAIQAMEKRIDEIENHHFALSMIASLKKLIEGHVKVLSLWSETTNTIQVRKRDMATEHRRLRSNLHQDQKSAGVAGTPQGDVGISDFENRCLTQLDVAKSNDAALISQTISKANELSAESQVWAQQAEKTAKLSGEGADLGAERGVLTAALAEVHHKKDKAQMRAITNSIYSIDSMASASSAASVAVLQAIEIEEQRYRLDVEMAARQHDGKSIKAATIIQCLLRVRLANKIVNKKMGEESDSDDGGGRRRGRRGRGRPKSRGGKSDKGQVDSDSDEDEERYRKKNKKRKKRMEKREERKRLQAEYEKRRAAGEVLDSLSELEPSDLEDNDLSVPTKKASSATKQDDKDGTSPNILIVDQEPAPEPKQHGPPILPGQIDDNPLLFGDQTEAKAADNVFQRMMRRQGVDPRTAPYNTSALLARRAKTPKTGNDSGGGGGLMGKMGGGLLGGDSSDADESSGDENAFATKAFASMGATSKIVPLNRTMIRAEADNAMDEKLSGLLDEKLKAIDDSKKQLELLQEGIVEKMKLLDEKVEASNQLALTVQSAAAEQSSLALVNNRRGSVHDQGEGGDQVGELAIVESPGGALPSGWSEMYDEASGASYYFNDVTGETSWTAPGHDYASDGYDTSGSKGTAVDYDTDAAWDSGYDDGGGGDWGAQGGGDYGYDGGGGGGGGGGDWTEQWDEEVQAAYWFNSVTLEASWTQPEGWNASGGEGGGGGGGDVGEWISYIDDESGKEYWYNETTEETSWTPR